MQEEKAGSIRSLSHDIRTQLTSIFNMKVLTDRLWDGGVRQPEYIENGRFSWNSLFMNGKQSWKTSLTVG